MKTLDEVVKALEICSTHQRCIDGCPYYRNDCPQYEMENDALHYLREYRKDKQIYAYDIARRNLELAERNDPLTWDELREMEGKPVWVEESAENGLWWTYWVIWQDDNIVLPKKDYSTKWRAYRKERNE